MAKPALDLIEPGGVSRCVVNVEAWSAREPDFDLGVFVGAIVVNDQMNIQMCGYARFDMTQEAQELLVPMVRLALTHDLPVGYAQCGERNRE